MAEDTPKAQSPVMKTQEVPMPGTQEQKIPEQSVTTEKQDELPEGVSERTTREFEKIKNDLREERQRREQIESAFKALSQPKPSTPEPIYDPVTGLIDGQQLTDLQKKTYEAEQRANRAEQAVSNYMRQQEERLAYEAHPWLDPNNKKEFNQDKYNLATGIALASMVDPGKFNGKQLDLKGAGDYVTKLTSVQVEKVKQEAVQQAIEQLSPKEQAALEATGNAGRISEMSEDLEGLRQITRKGGSQSINAIIERLKALKTQA